MNATVDLLHLLLPSTVGIRASIPESHPSAQILGTERMGSGTIVERGLVLTANYVPVGATSVEVTYFDNRSGPATVVAQDFYTGLALLRIADAEYPHVPLRPSDTLRAGQEVFIVASAGGSQRRVNTGAITTIQPFDAFWEFRLERAMTTTIMNPGLGGGALFAMDGSMCGVVSLDLNEVGHFTLAIPTENFSAHRDELLEHGRRVSRPPRAWVGIYCYKIGEHILVAGILPGTPAERAGLKAGDLILAVDGRAVTDRSMLYESIWRRSPGDEITLKLYSDEKVREVRIASDDADRFFA